MARKYIVIMFSGAHPRLPSKDTPFQLRTLSFYSPQGSVQEPYNHMSVISALMSARKPRWLFCLASDISLLSPPMPSTSVAHRVRRCHVRWLALFGRIRNRASHAPRMIGVIIRIGRLTKMSIVMSRTCYGSCLKA